MSAPFALPSIVAVSETPQTVNPVCCETTLNAHVVLALPCVMVLSVSKNLLASILVAIFAGGGVGEDVGDGLGVLVGLGDGEGLIVAVLLTALEVVVLVEVEVFSVKLAGTTLFCVGEVQPATKITAIAAKIIRSEKPCFSMLMRRELTWSARYL